MASIDGMLEGEPFQGEIGPSLAGIGSRLTEEKSYGEN